MDIFLAECQQAVPGGHTTTGGGADGDTRTVLPVVGGGGETTTVLLSLPPHDDSATDAKNSAAKLGILIEFHLRLVDQVKRLDHGAVPRRTGCEL